MKQSIFDNTRLYFWMAIHTDTSRAIKHSVCQPRVISVSSHPRALHVTNVYRVGQLILPSWFTPELLRTFCNTKYFINAILVVLVHCENHEGVCRQKYVGEVRWSRTSCLLCLLKIKEVNYLFIHYTCKFLVNLSVDITSDFNCSKKYNCSSNSFSSCFDKNNSSNNLVLVFKKSIGEDGNIKKKECVPNFAIMYNMNLMMLFKSL